MLLALEIHRMKNNQMAYRNHANMWNKFTNKTYELAQWWIVQSSYKAYRTTSTLLSLFLTLNIRNTLTQSFYCKFCLPCIISSRTFFSLDEISELLNNQTFSLTTLLLNLASCKGVALTFHEVWLNLWPQHSLISSIFISCYL